MSTGEKAAEETSASSDFIRTIIDGDLESGKHSTIVTRFPPEPNGFLHVGHAKSICLNFGIKADYNGRCNLRFDDTNPVKEEQKYVDAIKADVEWLGFTWDEERYASDYFGKMYKYALTLIKNGDAYVCSLSADEVRETRGTLTEPGTNSPFRDRSVEENLDLFEKMKAGEFEDGTHTLRAKIDMASPNMNMRDPAVYRIRHAHHQRTGDDWCIYPMYDYAHCISDSIEGITHSICTLEFEDHRPLYDWFLEKTAVPVPRPRQIEFARLNLNYTMMSKRNLLKLVEDNIVGSWDDPRMPTLAGMRRRGYTKAAIHDFCSRIGVAKANSTVDFALLEHCLREDLNVNAERRMAVLDPIKVVITNYPEGKTEEFEAENNPTDETAGMRPMEFSREVFIEREDFMEDPPKKFFRLGPGREVRLKYAYYITCEEVIKDNSGKVVELHCSYDPESRGGNTPDERKVKGTLHWVSASNGIPAEVRIYENLFTIENPLSPPDEREWTDFINPDSLQVMSNAVVEPALTENVEEQQFQFLRQGYFCADRVDFSKSKPVFNRIVGLRDTWAKVKKK